MKKKIILAIILCLVTVVTAGNVIIEEDSLEIGTVNAQSHVFPTENAFLSYSLVGYWSGDNNALDYSGKGNDGTLSGATYTNGKFGKAFGFDGSNDYVSSNLGDFGNINATTFSAWVYPKAQKDGQKIIWQRGNNSPLLGLQMDFGTNKVSWSGSAFGDVLSSVEIPLNEWTHVAGTYNGTHGVIYINGVQKGIKADSDGIQHDNTNINIGAQAEYLPSYYFNGSIDEVRIWNRSLSQAEIKRLYGDYWTPSDTSETRSFYTTGNVSASNFVDLTPAWSKTPAEALAELLHVESVIDVSGNALINHNSLPEFTKVKILKDAKTVNCTEVCDKGHCWEDCDIEYIYQEGRNIGATATMLVEAVKALNENIVNLQTELCKYNNNYNWC